MAQITESLVLEFESNLDAGRHINSTMGEERQLIEAWKSWNRRAELTSEPVAWMSANQKSFVHNLDIGDSCSGLNGMITRKESFSLPILCLVWSEGRR